MDWGVQPCFAETFGPDLISRTSLEAPGVRLRYVQKLDKDSAPLLEGTVDLETGVIANTRGPELCTQALFRDRLAFRHLWLWTPS